jgi:putative phage-type endonuclease
LVVALDQNTRAWHDWRRKGIGASEAAIILGISPWSTPYELWLEKTGRVDRTEKTNFAIERGKRWENQARQQYEWESDLSLPPKVYTHPEYDFIKASLDGFNEANGIILEIKIPGTEVFDKAKEGFVHDKYYPQCQQQLMVAAHKGAKECHFFCAKVEKDKFGNESIVETALVVVVPDPEFQKKLLLKLKEFWNFVQKDIPPPLTSRDTVFLEDMESINLFSRLRKAKEYQRHAEFAVKKAVEALGEKEAQFEDLKEEAIEYLESFEQRHSKYRCKGILIFRDKNGTWNVRLDKPEPCNESVAPADTTTNV